MGSRNPYREMTKSWGSFDTTVKLCKDAHTKANVKRYQGLLNTLESSFYKFDEDWRLYKDHTIQSVCKTEGAFNADVETEGVVSPAFTHNDSWFDTHFSTYVTVRDQLQDVLDQQQVAGDNATAPQPVANKYEAEFGIEEIKTDISTITSSINKLKSDIEGYTDQDMPTSQAQAYDVIIAKLNSKIDSFLKPKIMTHLASPVECTNDEYSHANLKKKFAEFRNTSISSLNTCSMILVKKIATPQVEEKPDSALLKDTMMQDVSGSTFFASISSHISSPRSGQFHKSSD